MGDKKKKKKNTENTVKQGTLKEEIIISLYLIEVFSNGNSFTFLYCVSKELNIPPLSAKCPIAQGKVF